MATVINNPSNGGGSDNGMGVIIGIIVLLILAALFVIYVLPQMRGQAPAQTSGINLDVHVPTPTGGSGGSGGAGGAGTGGTNQ